MPLASTELDDSASGRAAAAYEAESGKWEGLIEDLARDFGLSREQRTNGMMALRGSKLPPVPHSNGSWKKKRGR